MSKKKATIEKTTSVFGAEFVDFKCGMELLHGLRYKVCIMDVPILGLLYNYGDTYQSSTIFSGPILR